jgi:hypothetical protein
VVWVSWLQNLPRDFGARVVFMATFADQKISNISTKFQDLLNMEIDPPKTNVPKMELFASMCTPTLKEAAQKNSESSACADPSSLSPSQLSAVVSSILEDMVAVKNKKVLNVYMPRSTDPNAIDNLETDVHKSIANAKMTLEKIKNMMNDSSYGGLTTKLFDNVG